MAARIDSPACFAALLGTPENGRWQIAPATPEIRAVRRRYRPGTLVVETEYETETGAVRLIDCMPMRSETPTVVRVVEGTRGQVAMSLDLVVRLDYGSLVPWVRRTSDGIWAIGGASALRLRTPVALRGERFHTVAEFTVAAGQRVPFALNWYPSCDPEPLARRQPGPARAARRGAGAVRAATFLRPSPTSASSTPRAICPAAADPPSIEKKREGAGGYAGCSSSENRRVAALSRSRSSE